MKIQVFIFCEKNPYIGPERLIDLLSNAIGNYGMKILLIKNQLINIILILKIYMIRKIFLKNMGGFTGVI